MKSALLLALFACSTAIAQPKPGWVLPEVNAPRVQRVLFDSKTAAEPVSCYVFTPESYDTDKERRFPVLYWLHGSGGSTPVAVARLAQRYGAAMRAGQIPEMIVVFPNGLPMGHVVRLERRRSEAGDDDDRGIDPAHGPQSPHAGATRGPDH